MAVAAVVAAGAGGTKGGKSRGRAIGLALFGILRKRTSSQSSLLPLAKKCDQTARSLLKPLNLINAAEKNQVHMFVSGALRRLTGSDKGLPQVKFVQDLLQKGIGVHHGGMLPILKEVVEMLFSKGLVKILFATETFAMGVNFPARTVAFHGTRKHDGTQFRSLLPGEYTQMSGRAGRRGLDDVGTVIITAWDNNMPEFTTCTRCSRGNLPSSYHNSASRLQ